MLHVESGQHGIYLQPYEQWFLFQHLWEPNSNIISGLASGMDTEAMIEGMVQGYQQKITQLGQDRTMLHGSSPPIRASPTSWWSFPASICPTTPPPPTCSAPASSTTILTSANGTYADLVSATGKSSSTIVLNAVAQLAEAARYTHDAPLGWTRPAEKRAGQAGRKKPLSTMSGSLAEVWQQERSRWTSESWSCSTRPTALWTLPNSKRPSRTS